MSIPLAAALFAAALLPQPVTPIAPVPRFGPGSPVYTEPERYGVAPDGSTYAYERPPAYTPYRSSRRGYGRAGPPGAVLAAGQVGPTCMGQLWPRGFHAVNVDCPLYLPARPGAVEHCVGRDAAGRTTGVRVTFLDWNPATRTGAISCRRE